MSNNYIDKHTFLNEVAKYQDACAEARRQGKAEPSIPDSIGLQFIQMAKGIASRPNWRQYTYIDEMIADGIAQCCRAVKSFDRENNHKNPFGYFSRTIWNAFIQRWKKEKKQTYIKYKAYEHHNIENFDSINGDDAYMMNPTMDVSNEKIEKLTNMFENGQKKSTKNVERFIKTHDD